MPTTRTKGRENGRKAAAAGRRGAIAAKRADALLDSGLFRVVDPDAREIDSHLMALAETAHEAIYGAWHGTVDRAADAALKAGYVLSVDLLLPEDAAAVAAVLGWWLSGQDVIQSVVSWYDPARQRLYVRGKSERREWVQDG
jgi:hypothetical protein